jgi:hypothetical protein
VVATISAAAAVAIFTSVTLRLIDRSLNIRNIGDLMEGQG